MFLITLVSDAFQLLSLLIIVRAVLSWIPSVDHGHPIVRLIGRITDPIIEPIRRLVPPLGGLDLSPLAALLLLQVVGGLVVRLLASILVGA